ncbi:hypothetical protein [Dyadobacter sandarakinus]|uniref:Heavy-metal resistance n=1 Tax=Dyadobacter sandarakinus TaxID=2747268 RepID=A0ABX7I7J0_9BACT|nr:hypothetical protein [Dyadobacter sandarakinus]QRR01889.1 hypothetical protein HWI92_13715 [Dyadobacter sandarakinus]
MKKTILAIAAIVTLTLGNASAQYRVGHEVSAARVEAGPQNYSVGKLDAIVHLSRKQEKEMQKIEIRYDRLISGNKRYQTYQHVRRLEADKQNALLDVLTPAQRQRLYAYERSQRPEKGRSYRRG